MKKSTFIPVISCGLTHLRQPRAALTQDSSMKYNGLCYNRFHKSKSTLAFPFRTFYSEVPDLSRPLFPGISEVRLGAEWEFGG